MVCPQSRNRKISRKRTDFNKPKMVLNFFMKVLFAYFAANILIKYVK